VDEEIKPECVDILIGSVDNPEVAELIAIVNFNVYHDVPRSAPTVMITFV